MDFICSQQNFLKNPNKLPLNELQLEVKTIKRKKKLQSDKNIDDLKDKIDKNYDVRIEKIPALDPHWIQKEHSYNKYQPYYSEVSKEENELFLSKNKLFLDNLKFLLQCTYHQFWNYILFEPRIKIILRSFLCNPIHMYQLKYLEGEYLTLYNEIFLKISNVYLRMMTARESNIEFMSEDTMIKLIETNKLITYSDIINFFMLYNKTNQKFISKIQNLFFSEKQKSVYTKEMVRVINHALLVFEMVGGQVCGFEENAVVIPVGIRPKPIVFDPFWVEEVTHYLLDTAATLHALLSNCPPTIQTAISLGLPYRLTYFYNRVYPTLYEMLDDRASLTDDQPDMKTKILDNMATGRSEFVNAFHAVMTSLMNDIIQTLGDNEKQDAALETYLSLITAGLEDELFISDYHNSHQIDVQFQTLADFHPHMDHMRVNYILECLSTLPTMEQLKEIKFKTKPELSFAQPVAPNVVQENGLNSSDWGRPRVYTETELHDLTKSVMDTLPHLGDGFIRECLKYYNHNPADVVSAILDESLPPHLNNLPNDLIYLPPEPKPEQPILAYKGKRPDYKDATQLLDDKTDLEGVKDFVLKTSNISFDMYDDEYDDRYDEPAVKFYDKTDESSMYEHMGKRFEGYELISDPSESSSEDEVEKNASKPRDAFCEDPAVLRARREANRSTRGKCRDVVGKPKGQGQDKTVLQNREKKNVHKSSRANYNRKGGAQWKRNKGMIPS